MLELYTYIRMLEIRFDDLFEHFEITKPYIGTPNTEALKKIDYLIDVIKSKNEETINKKEFIEHLKANLKKIEESVLHIKFIDEKNYSEGLLRGQRSVCLYKHSWVSGILSVESRG